MPGESLHHNQIPEPEHELRPYQENGLRIIEEARHEGVTGGYLNWATGLGKSLVGAHSVKNYLEENPGGKALVLAHRGYILQHLSEDFGGVVGTHSRGHMFGQEFEDQGRVVFASFQAMNRRLGGGQVYEAFDPKEFGYVVVDEFHHGPAPTYRQVIDYFQAPFKLGLTATPERRDRQDIGKIFGSELDAILLEQAIANGWLARPEYHVLTDQVRQLDPKDLEGRSLAAINKLLFVPKRDEEIAATVGEHWERLRMETGREPRMLVFCPSIPHTEYFASLLPGNPETLHSKQQPDEQDKNWEDFRSGKINGLLAVDMLNEGVDVPDVDLVVFLRATESRAIYLQQVGRGLRLHPGKDKVIFLDFVASWERLHTLKTLEEGIKQASHPHGQSDGSRLPQFADTEAEFHYSAEALQAIETIKYARGAKKRPRSIKETPRADEWVLEEAEVKELLHLSELPKQRITREEWEEYAARLAEGDQDVKLEVFQRYLRTAYSTARTYAKSHPSSELTVDDFFQTAMIAVYQGVEKYDASNKNNLRETIALSIFSALTSANVNRGIIHLPASYYEFMSKFEKGRTELVKKLGEQVVEGMTFEELAVEIGFNPETAEEQHQLGNFDYEQMVDEAYADALPVIELNAFEQAVQRIDKHLLRKAMENLSYRERRVLELRFGLGGENERTLEEVGRTFNVTRDRIWQIEKQAVKKLQSLAEVQKLRPVEEVGFVELPKNWLHIEKARQREWFSQAGQMTKVQNNGRYKQIAEEDSVLAGMAYHLHEILTHEYVSSSRRLSSPGREIAIIDKNRLFERFGARFGGEAASYNDFVRTLRAMESVGLLTCKYNERGSIIENVQVSLAHIRNGQIQAQPHK